MVHLKQKTARVIKFLAVVPPKSTTMKKNLAIIYAAWQRALTYRFNTFFYRLGEMTEIIVLVLMWRTIYSYESLIRGYTLQEMITYILIGNLVNVMVRNWLPDVVAEDIKNGTLSFFLIKPISYFKYIIFREIGRISLTFFLSVAIQLLIISFFLEDIILPSNVFNLIIIVIMIVLAFVMELFLSFLVGLIAFWTAEVGGIYSTISRVTKFFAGGYFPLTLLPQVFVQASFLLPFAYTFFIPAQLYLGKIDIATGLKGIVVQIFWIAALFIIIKIAWKRGLRVFEGVGI